MKCEVANFFPREIRTTDSIASVSAVHVRKQAWGNPCIQQGRSQDFSMIGGGGVGGWVITLCETEGTHHIYHVGLHVT